jgi:hypothetical protein
MLGYSAIAVFFYGVYVQIRKYRRGAALALDGHVWGRLWDMASTVLSHRTIEPPRPKRRRRAPADFLRLRAAVPRHGDDHAAGTTFSNRCSASASGRASSISCSRWCSTSRASR